MFLNADVAKHSFRCAANFLAHQFAVRKSPDIRNDQLIRLLYCEHDANGEGAQARPRGVSSRQIAVESQRYTNVSCTPKEGVS